MVWAEGATAAELATAEGAAGSIGTLTGDPDSLYVYDGTTWNLIDKEGLAAGVTYEGISPQTLLMVNKLMAVPQATLNALNVMTTRGDIIVQGASAPARLELGVLGRVLYAGSTDPFWQIPGNLLISDPYNKYATDTIDGAFNELGALLALDRKPEYIRAADPTAQNDQYEGMLLYNTTDNKLKVCTTPGEAEWDTFTVSLSATAATSAGNVTVTLNGVAFIVAVAESETVDQVAAKIRAAALTGWTAETGTGAIVDVKKDAVGECSEPLLDGGTTGVTFATITRTNEGVDAVWYIINHA